MNYSINIYEGLQNLARLSYAQIMAFIPLSIICLTVSHNLAIQIMFHV